MLDRQTDAQTDDRHTTQYIDNRVTAAHVRVLDRQTDGQTDDRQITQHIDNRVTVVHVCTRQTDRQTVTHTTVTLHSIFAC